MSQLSFTFKKGSIKEVKIIIGDNTLKNLAEVIAPLNIDKVFVVADSGVVEIYGQKVIQILSQYYETYLITQPSGENNKDLSHLSDIVSAFFDHNGTPNSCIFTLGGGVVENIAGLAASIIYRGIKLVHLPTTLLAQLDSAPDVKQSINSFNTKNSIGAYKAPDLVLIDVSFLKTLDDREIKSGLAEAFKHAISQDLAFIDIITSFQRKDIKVLEIIVARTISLKIEHWKNTPTMWNDKHKTERLTHLGHTIGKVLEIIDLEYLTHGEAISHGMMIEFYISFLEGYLNLSDIDFARQALNKIGLLPVLNQKYTVDEVIKRLYYTKSTVNDPIFALLGELGNPNTISTTSTKEKVVKAITWYLNRV